MTWPTGAIGTGNLDSGTADSPAAARAQLKEAVDKLNEVIAHGEPPTFGRLLGVQLFETAGATAYVPTAGTSRVVVEIQAAGGAGGGALAVGGGSGQSSVGSGGGAGAYMQVLITSGFAGEVIVVPSANAGVSGADGPNGGAASFGGFGCNGGYGGKAETVASATFPRGVAQVGLSAGPSSVTATPGTYKVLSVVAGKLGGHGLALASGFSLVGAGADCPSGAGMPQRQVNSGTPGGAIGRGGGGPGAAAGPGNGPFPGGSGGAGLVRVWEYA